MKNRLAMLALTGCSSLLLISSCDTAKTRETANQVRAETVNPRVQLSINNLEAMEKNGIVVTPYTPQRSMGEAQIRVRQPEPGQVVEPGAVNFTCDVSNFRLGVPPTTTTEQGMTLSPLGQSITTIVDNEVINEHDKATFTESLTEGEHVVLSFLTRATREALKHRLAYDLRVVNVGKAVAKTPFNAKAPAIFYNLPRGTYTGDEADKILLDFVVVNAAIEEEGTNVRLTINKTPFTLTRWAAYTIEGLPMGPNTIQLELINAEGHAIPGPFNNVTRTITLRPGA